MTNEMIISRLKGVAEYLTINIHKAKTPLVKQKIQMDIEALIRAIDIVRKNTP